MEAWFIKQWQRNGPWQILLRPVSWLFLLLVMLRRAAYRLGWLKVSNVGVPVIMVGNINVGGTGKTPLVLALVEALTRHGKHCGIVTRGYQPGANVPTAEVVQVVPTGGGAGSPSDEATLLARRSGVPVYTAANRVQAARTLLRNHGQVDVIISDDGLQHYALQRDIEICVIDSARGLGNGALLPAGPLREPASRLDEVDAIIVNLAANVTDVKNYAATTPAFEMTLANEIFINLKSGRSIGVTEAIALFQGLRIHALAGIGNPQRFFAHLVRLGLAPNRTQPFPDHHDYQSSDMPGIDAGIILMTEKDAVKCGSFADERMWYMRIDALLPNKFIELVLQKLSDWKA